MMPQLAYWALGGLVIMLIVSAGTAAITALDALLKKLLERRRQ